MTVSIRTVLLTFLFLVSLLLISRLVSYTDGEYTYSMWTGLETEQSDQSVDGTREVVSSVVTYKVDNMGYSETVTDKTVEDSIHTAADIDHLTNTKSETVIAERDEIDKEYERLLGCRKLPDVLTIGFEKCGTATLKEYLGIHPQIFVTREENYELFSEDFNMTVEEYTKNAKCTPPGQFRVNKLAIHGTAERTYRFLPYIKLLAVVREPVERAMSHYIQALERGKESKKFTFDSRIASILDSNNHNIVKSSILFTQSRYIEKLEPWIARYGLDRIHIVDGDAFAKYPVDELRKVENFLGLKPFITQDHFVYNTEKKFYCRKENGESKCMPSRKGRAHPQMSSATRTRLQEYFKPFNLELFRTVGRNFSWNY